MPKRTTGARAARLAVEFIIVVFGVLAALAVDSWRESQSEKALEEYYLRSLESDLISDSTALALSIQRLEAMRPMYLDSLMRGQGELVDTTAVLQIMRLRLEPVVRLSSPTFSELLGSGTLGVIRAPELRTALRSYYAQAQQARRVVDRRPPVDFEQVVATDAFWIFDQLLRGELTPEAVKEIEPQPVLEQMSHELEQTGSYLRQRHLYALVVSSALIYLRDSHLTPTLLQVRRALEQ